MFQEFYQTLTNDLAKQSYTHVQRLQLDLIQTRLDKNSSARGI